MPPPQDSRPPYFRAESPEAQPQASPEPDETAPSVADTYELADAAPAAAAAPAQDDLQEKVLYLAAELENVRKRSRREQDDARRFGIERLLLALLPVLDNLERALAHAPAAADPVIEGVRMVAKSFTDVLAAQGVVALDTAPGQDFDPSQHEAVSKQTSTEVRAGTILHALQRGYRLHGRLLRPAQVVVADGPPAV